MYLVDVKTVISIDVPGKHEGGYALLRNGVLSVGKIVFDPHRPEREDFLVLKNLLDECRPDVVIMEHPFLHLISGWIGGIKFWAACNNVAWWQIGPSKAKRIVLKKGGAKKEEVLTWVRRHTGRTDLTQHQADAILYLEAWRLTQAGGKNVL